ncbi:hypothetical protein [Motilimonas eburnea]|uniref:hypothetical protein n=1 Tax=Motilimonas eburnea TaxID=1737488 RepID=UPI001E5E9368|nr:hypothetical protein [Motilimonas eburnea]MCE2573370.1 hypothetical protein [Motilimonas eburnea]
MSKPYTGVSSIACFALSFPSALLVGKLSRFAGDYYGYHALFAAIITFFGFIILGTLLGVVAKMRHQDPHGLATIGLIFNGLVLVLVGLAFVFDS